MSNNNTSELSEAVRSWVHFDNLAESLNKQVANVRNLRNQFETKILEIMDRMGLHQNASLKITGAVLQRAQRSKQSDLSWSFLEEQLHEYHKASGKRDETAQILQFLQTHRGSKSVEYLKKTSVSPANTAQPTHNARSSTAITAGAGATAGPAAATASELRNKVVS
jgi:hypothetical protein